LICPQCGFEQPEAAECARCGVRVDLYREMAPAPAAPAPPAYGGGFVGVGAIYGIPPPAPSASASPAGPSVPVGHLETGPVLHDAFAIFFANFLPFVAVSAVALLPRIALGALAVVPFTPQTMNRLGPAGAGVSCLVTLGKLLADTIGVQTATGAITYGVLKHPRGVEVTVGESLAVGLRAMGRVLGAALLSGFGIGLGALACLVPGIVLAVRWSVAVPVALEEAPGAGASLSRSSTLTEGSRWPIFAVLVILWILNFGVIRLAMLALGVLAGSRQDLVTALAEVLTTAVSGTASAVIYYRLRSLKESIDVRHLASVFD